MPTGLEAADLNGDNSIDIVDLSVLLYYYGQRGQGISRYDLNDNGVIDLPDISILMYYWTG